MTGGPGLWFPETGNVLNAQYRTPMTDQLHVIASQQGKPCGYFERQFFRCTEAFGAKLARKYCDLELRDYKECLNGDKQRKRSFAIRNERIKQWVRGERDTIYEDHIRMGQHKPHYFSDDLPW